MRIAIYGEETSELVEQKKWLEAEFQKMEKTLQVDYYTEKDKLYDNLILYDMVCEPQTFVKKLKRYIDQQVKKNIVFVVGSQIQVYQEDEIYYIEAHLKMTRLWGKNGMIELRFPLSKAEIALKGHPFVKIHRSYIVNTAYIAGMSGNAVILKDGTTLPVSRHRQEGIKGRF